MRRSRSRAEAIRSGFAKYEHMIPMRDGTRLFTAVYVPYDASKSQRYPILMVRTPYGSGPYGADQYRSRLGPSVEFEEEGRFNKGGEIDAESIQSLKTISKTTTLKMNVLIFLMNLMKFLMN